MSVLLSESDISEKENNEQVKTAATGKIQKKRVALVVFRWFALSTFLVHFLLEYEAGPSNRWFYIIFSLAALYNLIVTSHILNNQGKTGHSLALHLDITFVSALTALQGNAGAELYVLYLFILAYSGFKGNVLSTFRAGVVCVAEHLVFSILAYRFDLAEVDFARLVIRAIYLSSATYAMTVLSREIRKYGDLHRREFKLARTDKLTGLANRHYFEQKLMDEAQYSDYSGMPINILMFDIDNFKGFNDTYGHVWGDRILCFFADIIKQNIRKTDIPVRYGGEEFLILIRDLDIFLAKNVAERIRRQLDKQQIYIGKGKNRKQITVSCGIAQYPSDSKNIRKVVELADKALYAAKQTGKNRVMCYADVAEEVKTD